MLKQIEGSRAVAEAVALCRPEVICAYPITPQTHIVEGLSSLVREGRIENCKYINVESEFAALSVAIGSSAAGARSYTATSSQGLLYMVEAVYNASGLGLPIVMTLGTRAIGAPLNIWNDHSDAMSVRDAGWIQLFAETNQEAVDLHIQAFRIAEAAHLPVMVCVDGFILTHAVEQVDVPTQQMVDAYLPPFAPQIALDPDCPTSVGVLVGPEAFTEVKYLDHKKMVRSADVVADAAKAFKKIFNREAGGFVRPYRVDDAETVIVAMGSVVGTLKDMADEKRKQGQKIGVLSICMFRPFPAQEVLDALKNAKHVIVVEKALAPGQGGVLAAHVRLAGLDRSIPVTTLIAGLGGRPIFKRSLSSFVDKIGLPSSDELHFLDLRQDLVGEEEKKIEKERAASVKKSCVA